MKSSNKIFIYGAPGVGKTSFSLKLQKKLGCPLIEADYLREVVAQKENSPEKDPFIYVGTKEAFRHFGELNEENVIRGLKAVRKSMAPYVAKEILKQSGKLIMEGSFLDPQLLANEGKLCLVLTMDEDRHRTQFFKQREQNKNSSEAFLASRIIQNCLIQEAKRYSVKIIENDKDMDNLIEKLSLK